MILVVLPEGGCWRPLSALWKCGGDKSEREQGGARLERIKYIDKPLDMKNNDDRVYIDLLNSVDYNVILSGKSRKPKAL